MNTHLININAYGVIDNNYAKFFDKRCMAFSRELKKRIIENEIDQKHAALPAQETNQIEIE